MNISRMGLTGSCGVYFASACHYARRNFPERTKHTQMRNETLNIVDEIKQAISLLRRHL
jgi:hypothetical protein